MFNGIIWKIVDFYYFHIYKKAKPENSKKQIKRALKNINSNPNFYKDLHCSLKKK